MPPKKPAKPMKPETEPERKQPARAAKPATGIKAAFEAALKAVEIPSLRRSLAAEKKKGEKAKAAAGEKKEPGRTGKGKKKPMSKAEATKFGLAVGGAIAAAAETAEPEEGEGTGVVAEVAAAAAAEAATTASVGGDQPRWCFCRKAGAGGGEMVACDRPYPSCFRWYHLKCVGLRAGGVPERWTCRTCEVLQAYAGAAASQGGVPPLAFPRDPEDDADAGEWEETRAAADRRALEFEAAARWGTFGRLTEGPGLTAAEVAAAEAGVRVEELAAGSSKEVRFAEEAGPVLGPEDFEDFNGEDDSRPVRAESSASAAYSLDSALAAGEGPGLPSELVASAEELAAAEAAVAAVEGRGPSLSAEELAAAEAAVAAVEGKGKAAAEGKGKAPMRE